MKNIIKKMSFVLLLVVICGFTAIASQAASEYTMTISSRSMNVGLWQTTQVSATVDGLETQPEISWSTTDENIATVNSSGKVRGKAIGNFEVIATAVIDGETITAKFPMKVVKFENQFNTFMEFTGIMSYQYSYDYGYYYANDKTTWQGEFGFAMVYDFIAPYFGYAYDSVRVFFTYDDQDFMVQLWKGKYILLRGGEIGIYHRDADGLSKDPYTLYNAAEEKYWPVMDMSIYEQKKEGDAPEDYELLFRRPVEKYWWCTGFVLGVPRNTDPADELRMEAVLTFNDSEMAAGFANGLIEHGFKEVATAEDVKVDEYYVDGANVTISWQNINEPVGEKNWKNIGVFLSAMVISVAIKLGAPELVKSFFK